ncbi:MAG: S4A5 electrogenic sodium bicarbonate cotransporter 4 [Eggerthellaceae bacterium]|nr:S4A5 electrogenic sodium bicarbonate cotransporter 4 [Eggerthellaceae bacterium]
MSLRANETVIRMGPITVISLLIVIALATLGVLSLTTARASNVAASKQDSAIVALYQNESDAQQFLADLDAALIPARTNVMTATEAAASVKDAPALEGADIDGITISKSFENEKRKLNVIVVIRDDLNYQVISWKTESKINTAEEVELWQGNNAQ